jgi:uncharacterized protein (DUF433 family)
MGEEYIKQRDGGYFLKGTRVSLDSVIYAFLRGESPEEIANSFPALELEQIFGALAFYMANRQAIDSYLSEGRTHFEAMRRQTRKSDPAFYAKLESSIRRLRALRTPLPMDFRFDRDEANTR